MLPRAVLILWKFYNVVGEFSQLQVREAVVAEVLEKARAAGGGLVAHQRAHAHAHAAHAHAAHAAAHQLCKHTTQTRTTYLKNKAIPMDIINIR